MYCDTFKATMSIHACIRRQTGSKLYNNIESIYDHSLLTCKKCDQGKKIISDPDCSTDRDYHFLKNNQLKIIEKRGWIFKESISLESLYDTFDCSQIKLNRRKSNAKKGTNYSKQRGITRFIRKHRLVTRSKQNFFQSFRTDLTLKQKLGYKDT
jgi:hypothetical protein